MEDTVVEDVQKRQMYCTVINVVLFQSPARMSQSTAAMVPSPFVLEVIFSVLSQLLWTWTVDVFYDS